MYALPVRKLPEGQDWLYETKFDGYRCLTGNVKFNAILERLNPMTLVSHQ